MAPLIENTAYDTQDDTACNYDNKSLYNNFCFAALTLAANNTRYNKKIENYYNNILHKHFYFSHTLPANYDQHNKVQTCA